MDRRRRAARTVALMSLFTTTDTQTDVPIASFDGDGSDLISLIVGIEPVQAGSGDPSPDNVRPISGWTGAKVTRTGKNLFDKTTGAKNLYVGTGNVTGTDGTLLCFFAKKGAQYTINMTGGNRTNLFYYDTTSLDDIVSGITLNVVTLSAAKPYTFIAEHDAVYCYYADTNFQQAVADSCMVELGSSATTYEPYAGETYSITFPSSAGTVYGGTLDVTQGKLTVDRATVDAGNLRWAKDSSGTFYAPWQQKKAGSLKITCSELATLDRTFNFINYADYPDNIIGGNIGATNHYFYAKATAYATATDFKAAMSGVQLVYELATPIVYDLTPTEVSTLLGTNNIWADTGDIKYIEYNI